MNDDFNIDDMLKDLKETISVNPSNVPGIEDEESLSSFSFLFLECLQSDIGRAMAIRNFWMHLCSQ